MTTVTRVGDLERVRATPYAGSDAREGRGRGGTDYAGNLHTPDCDARDGEGRTHWHACGLWRGLKSTLLTRSVLVGDRVVQLRRAH